MSLLRAAIPPTLRRTWWLPAAAVVGFLMGVFAARLPIAAFALLGLVGTLVLLSLGKRAIPVFHGGLLAILAGYAFFGKGFAYLGAPPLYVGEVVLLLGLLTILLNIGTARFGVLHGLIVAFMLWCALRTVPFIGTYGIDALRDGATWGYAIFALAVSVSLVPLHFARLATGYRLLIPVFLAWVPIAAALTLAFEPLLPRAPGSDVPITVFKGGDTSVHLAAIAAFLLLGLDRVRDRFPRPPHLFMWPMWIVNAALVAALNRAAFLALTTVAAVVLFVRESGRWFTLILFSVAIAALLAVVNPAVELGLPRSLSVDQLVQNALSLFGSEGGSVNEATKNWRYAWWNTIIDYTVNGQYAATGKGFGINLADADGFQVLADGSLRAPHSVHFEILARAGVPGLVLWILLQGAFCVTLLRSAFRASRTAPRWVPVLAWVFVYWAAAMIDGSFDVYIGGPQGGIWFWAVMGLGIAAIQMSAEQPNTDPLEPIDPLDPVDPPVSDARELS
jgi:O-Antigen ligase